MKKETNNQRIPIKFWLDDIEDKALKQAENLANLPFAFNHIALMPDCHPGYGMPIGSVLATKNVVIPNAVSVDIGCGVCAVKTSLTEIDTDTLKKIMGKIRKVIPVGLKKHKKHQDQDSSLMPRLDFKNDKDCMDWGNSVVEKEYKNALISLGTLGGGNHFIEIQKGDDEHIWIMIHSGSRNLGLQVNKYYNDLAKKFNKKWYSSVNLEHDLAFMPMNSKEGLDYLREMQYCIEYALANRSLMMGEIVGIFSKYFSAKEIIAEPLINIAHNYASAENHFGENVIVHRKGATLAREGTIGIIPGSQGSKSYIVKGKGNKDSFMSCSHGAGRLMSRTKAKESLSIKEEAKKLDKMGVIHSIRSKNDLDEAPSAYKNIETVMDNQSDLVEIKVELTPLAVIKG